MTLPSNIKTPTPEQARAELCRRSLYRFLKEFWGVLNNVPLRDNWHLEFLCDKIQLTIDHYVLNRPPHIPVDKWYNGITENISKNLVYVIAPGTTKSTILSRMAPAWLWAIDASKTWISNTIDTKNATEYSTSTMDIINSEKYQTYFPDVKIRYNVSAKTFYQSNKGGKRYSLTTRGSNTGKHADVIGDDDPMDYPTAQSRPEAKECIEGFKSLQTRKKDKTKTVYILGMQRLSSFDTVKHALEVLSDVDFVCLPSENIYKNVEPAQLVDFYEDGLLDPIGLSRKILADTRLGLTDKNKPISDIAYNIQFNQASETGEDLMYKLNFVPNLPQSREDVIRFSFTDVADTGADNFATWFCEMNKGKVYIFDAVYTTEDSKITGPKIKTKIELHGSIKNKMESNNQGSVFITYLQALGTYVEGYYSSGNKENRISAYAQLAGFVSFVQPGAYHFQSVEYERAIKHLVSYPKVGKHEDGHDDAEDAFTELLRYFYINYKQLFLNIEPIQIQE